MEGGPYIKRMKLHTGRVWPGGDELDDETRTTKLEVIDYDSSDGWRFRVGEYGHISEWDCTEEDVSALEELLHQMLSDSIARVYSDSELGPEEG